ncbi:MAG: M23 family metallopeptidase [Bacteroidia bacterium]|nr:M23 family metallopeptidase [Bacteroidia bacterium]
MRQHFILGIVFVLLLCSCQNKEGSKAQVVSQTGYQKSALGLKDSLLKLFLNHPAYLADGFDYPVGKPNAKNYYNAQPFGQNFHLGDDWNAVTGGNTDLGDPIYAIGNGYVKEARDYQGGWGHVIWLLHCMDTTRSSPKFIISLYAHADSMLVKKGQWIKKGRQIGTIGTAGGQYLAHLHLEIRDSIELPLGGGYSAQSKGYLNPTTFIKEN